MYEKPIIDEKMLYENLVDDQSLNVAAHQPNKSIFNFKSAFGKLFILTTITS